ncbi:MAG: YkgJ family cysteine cluster protein [Sandaracinaceae bacterium]
MEGRRCGVLHDDRRTGALVLGAREVALVRAMDGTRDLEGVRRAAGVSVALDELRRFAEQLGEVGALDAEQATFDEPAFARPLPVEAWPGGFRCDGAGECCASFDTVLFTSLERARARAAHPETLDAGLDEARAFSPDRDSDETLGAVACVDGRCAYRDPHARRCVIHPQRPHGCRTFPLGFLDVGPAIRVTVRMECACAFLEDGDRLSVPERGDALPRELHVPRLGETIQLGAHARCDAAEYVARLDALRADRPDADAILALAESWDNERFCLEDRLPRIAAELAQRAKAESYRAATDPTRLALASTERAARSTASTPNEGERRFVDATLFALLPEPHAAEALRRTALIIQLARRFSDEDRARFPQSLATVSALVRAQGLTLGAAAPDFRSDPTVSAPR